MLALVPAQALATHNSVGVDLEITRADEVDPETGELDPDLEEDTRIWNYTQRFHHAETQGTAAPDRIGPEDQSGQHYDPDECKPYEEFSDPEGPLTQKDAYENALPNNNNDVNGEDTSENACWIGILDDQAEYLLTGNLAGEDLTVIFFGQDNHPYPEAGYGAVSTHCLPCVPTENQNPDPLYPVNPEEDADCDQSNLECEGQGHTAYWPAYRMANVDVDLMEAAIGNDDDTPAPTSANAVTGTSEGSGTMSIPLLWTYKTFLYGYSHPKTEEPSSETAANIDQPLWGVTENACGVTDEENPDTIQRTPGGDDCRLLTPEDLAHYDTNAEKSEDIGPNQRGRLCDFTPQSTTVNPDDQGAGPCGVFGNEITPFYESTTSGGLGTDTAPTYLSTLPGYKAWFVVIGNAGTNAPSEWSEKFGTENTTGHDDQDYAANTGEASLRIIAVNPVVPDSNTDSNCVRPNILTNGGHIQDAGDEWKPGELEADIRASDDYDSVGNSFELEVTNDPASNAQPLNASGVSIETLSAEMEPDAEVTVEDLRFQPVMELEGSLAWLTVTKPDDTTVNLLVEEPIEAADKINAGDGPYKLDVSQDLDLSQEGEYTVEVDTDSSKVADYFAETFATVGNFQELGELPAPSIYGTFQADAIDNDAYPHGLNGLVQSLHSGEDVEGYDGYHETFAPVLGPADDAVGDALSTAQDQADEALGEVPEEVPGQDTLENTVDQTDDVVNRAQPEQADDAEPIAGPEEPNFATFSNVPEVEEGLTCQGAELELVSQPDPIPGRINHDAQLDREAIAIEDPTILDDENLPANKSRTSEGAWHTEAYSFSSPLVGYFDKGGSEGFDGCDPADGQPDPSLDDCAWTPVWDAYNPNCSEEDTEKNCAEVLAGNGYDVGVGPEGTEWTDEAAPTGVGLVATVELTGTTLVTNQPGVEDPGAVQEETVIVNQNPTERTCLVITSVGFDEYLPDHVPGMSDFTPAEAEALCSEDTDEVHLFSDGFENQEGPNERGFTSTVAWAPLTPTPDAVRGAADIGDQRLCVSTVFSTQESVQESKTDPEEDPGTSDTQSTVVLGADHTETYYTDCDVISQELQDGEPTAHTGDEGTFNTGASLVAAHTGAGN